MNTTTVKNLVRHIFNKNNVKISSIGIIVTEPQPEVDPAWINTQFNVVVEICEPISWKKYKKIIIDSQRKSDNIFIDIANIDF